MKKSIWSKSFLAVFAYFVLCILSGCENKICMNPACAAELAPAKKGKTTVMKYKDREFRLYVPAALSKSDKKNPLVVALHGGLGNAANLEANSNLDKVADQKGFVVAYLNGTGGWIGQMKDKRTWNAGNCCGPAQKQNVDDVEYIAGFIQGMIANNPIDPARIYLVGHSNGAMMAYRFVCERPGMVAAMVSVSGTFPLDKCTGKLNGLPVLEIHGANDRNIPEKGGVGDNSITGIDYLSVAQTAKIMQAAGASFNARIIPGGGHNIPDLNNAVQSSERMTLAAFIEKFVNGKTK